MGTEHPRRLAVITGASSGIGYELAQTFLEHDYDVLICAEDIGIFDAQEELSHVGPGVDAVRADLASYEGVEQLAIAIESMQRPVDALVLNAGVGVGGAFLDTDLQRELRMITLNCHHTVHLAKRVVPGMVQRGHGRILITGSVLSTAPSPYQAVYGATKAFVMSFGEALRYELKDTGVTVTLLQPGATDTQFFERADLENTPIGRQEKDDPRKVAKQGFEAMVRGQDSVIGGGTKSRIEGALNEVMPETVKARFAGEQTKPRH